MNIGKVSENILERSVLKNIGQNSATAGADCAIFTGYVSGEDSSFCGGHALLRANNNAVAAGKKPHFASVTITMPEKMREIKLKEISLNLKEVAQKLGISIIDGHTETVALIEYPIVTVTLFAREHDVLSEWKPSIVKPGYEIIMTKWMAMSGSAKLASKFYKELSLKYPNFIMDDAKALEQFYSIESEAAVAIKSGAIYMNDCSDGGIFAALWQLGKINGAGLEVNLKEIPVRQETIEICEFFDINPYKLRSDGSLLIVTDNAEKMIENLEKENIKASKIGYITDGIDRVILSGDDRRFLEEPRQDEEYMLKL